MSLNIEVTIDKDELKKSFKKEIQNIQLSKLANLEELKNIDTRSSDPADAATANEEIADLKMKNTRLDEKTIRIKNALHKIENNLEYGDCLECGYDIEVARLKAIPEATHCRPCLSDIERTNAQFA